MSLLPGGITLPELAGLPANPPPPGKFFVYMRAGAVRFYDSNSIEYTLSTGITAEEVEDIVGGLIASGSGITVTYNDAGDVLTIALDDTAVAPDTYGAADRVSQVTVDQQGRITSATDVVIAIPSTQITNFTEAVQDAMGGTLVDSASVDFQYNDGANTQTAVVLPAGVDHNSLANLTTGNPHTQYLQTSVAATTYQPLDADLTAVGGLATQGLITRTGAGTATTRSVAAGTGISVANGDGVSGNPTVTNSDTGTSAVSTHVGLADPHAQYLLESAAATTYQPLDADLTAVGGLSTQGLIVRTGAGTATTRSVAAGTGVTVSNGDGVSGNPTVAITNVGTAGTYGSPTTIPSITTNAQGQVTAVTNNLVAIPSTQVTDFNEAAQDAVGGILTDSSSVDFTYSDGSNTIQAFVIPGGVDHNGLANLAVGNPHTQYLQTSVAASSYQPLDADLTAVAGLATQGLVARTGAGTATTRSVAAGTGVSVSNGDGIAGNPTVALTNTGVVAGTYGNNAVVPQITVDAQGRVTGVANSGIAIGVANITDFAEQVDDQVNALVAAGTGISKTYNDAGNSLTIANTDTGSSAVATHEAAGDPHPQYLTAAEGNSAYQPLDADLTALAGLASTGIVCRTAANTYVERFIAISTGLSISNPGGVGGNPTISNADTGSVAVSNHVGLADPHTQYLLESSAAATYQPLDADLSAVAALGANGILVRTAPGGAAVRTIAGSSSVSVANGDAVAGSPTLSVLPAGVDHDALQNFVANEHVNHSSVSLVAGTGISATGLGDLTASRTINLANTAVVAGSYGSAAQVPVLTIDAQGRITNATTATVVGGEWTELINTATLTNSSNSTLADITNLTIPVVAGRTYRIEAMIKYRSAAAGTGLSLAIGLNSGATGVLAFTITIPTSTTAVATGHPISTATVITASSTPAANTDYVAQIVGIFTCTGSGNFVPQFRSESNGTTVTVQPGSNIISREWA
jgi:hypothetical protein